MSLKTRAHELTHEATQLLSASPVKTVSVWSGLCGKRQRSQSLIVTGALLFSGGNCVVKYATKTSTLSAFMMMLVRAVLSTFCNLCVVFSLRGRSGVCRAVWGHEEIPARSVSQEKPDEQGWRPTILVYGRGMVGVLLSGALVIAYTYLMSFSDAFAIYVGLSTLTGVFVAACTLGERIRISLVVGGMVTVAGVVLVAKPVFLFGTLLKPGAGGVNASAGQLAMAGKAIARGETIDQGRVMYTPPSAAGLLALCWAAVMSAAWYTLTRRLKRLSPETLLNGYMVCLIVGAGLGVLAFANIPSGRPVHEQLPQSLTAWLYCVIYTVLAQCAQLSAAQGFQGETASVGTVLANVEVVFAFIIDTIVLREAQDGYSMVGAAAVLVGAAIVVVFSHEQLADDDDVRVDTVIGGK